MKKKKLGLILICSILLIVVVSVAFVLFSLSPTSSDKTEIEFEVTKGSTYSTLANSLKEEGFIRSPFVYKIYVKLMNPKALEAGKYKLSKSMGVGKIIKVLSGGNTYNPDAVTVSVPEGKTIEQVAEYVASVTNHTKEELLEVWDSSTFVNQVIEKYWFVTDEVKSSDIRHPLEGYLFPSTYELTNKDVTAEYVAYRMLDQMDIILKKYQKDIEKSSYSVHELLTMASIVEYEAILDSDRPIVAGVFYNRLAIDMKLQSCATLGYAIDEWKLTYSTKDMNTKSKYNTYYYSGLPVGPGGMPSEASIKAAIYPDSNDYYYFMANVCDPSSQKTYFSKTLSEHEANVRKYLTCF